MGEVKTPDIPCPKIPEWLKEGLKTPEGKQKAYVWIDDEQAKSVKDSLLAELWICDAPMPGEELIIYEGDGLFVHYEVTRRIYGANIAEKVGVWNLYVKFLLKEYK